MHRFKPKQNTRKHPYVTPPMRLYDICLEQAMALYKKTCLKLRRRKKSMRPQLANKVRVHSKKTLAPDVRAEIVKRAVETYTAAEAVNILDLFYTDDLRHDTLNLVAANSLQFGIRCTSPVTLFNFNGMIQIAVKMKMNYEITAQNSLNKKQMGKLNRIFQRSSTSLHLSQFAVAVAPKQLLYFSTLPAIFTNFLTKLTIRTGATNTILRVVGDKCEFLTFLDVSLSSKVTDTGIQYLFLKQPSPMAALRTVFSLQRKSPAGTFLTTKSNIMNQAHFDELLQRERNNCANTLKTIVLTQTCVTYTGLNFVCRVMDRGFLLDLFPTFSKVFRIAGLTKIESKEVTLFDMIVDRVTSLDEHPAIPMDQVYKIKETFEGVDDLLVLYHWNLRISWAYLAKNNQITTLMVQPPVELNACRLGQDFPHLKYFFGKLTIAIGDLTLGHRERVMPNLEVVNSHDSPDSSVIIFLLRFAPELRSLHVFCGDQLSADEDIDLDDNVLNSCLRERDRQEWKLEDIVIVDCRKLTIRALRCLVDCCPNLKRIGDLDSWRQMTNQNIATFNEYLNSINSQCVLSVVSYPSTMREQEYHKFGMSFMEI